MDGHISAPAADVVRGVLVELVPVALGLVAVHRLHAQLLHPLPEGGARLFWFKTKEVAKITWTQNSCSPP